MEITFEAEVTTLGLKGANNGTDTVCERVAGQLYGEGRGVFMSSEGDSVI